MWFTNWWEGLTLLQQCFAVVAIPATVILLLQTVLLLFGMGGHDADHGEVDTDHDFDHDMDHELDHDTKQDFDHDAASWRCLRSAVGSALPCAIWDCRRCLPD